MAFNPRHIVGPGSATDESVVRYDGATGQLAQNSAVSVSDDGYLAVGSVSANEAITLDGVLSLKERLASPANSAGFGKLYVRSSDSHLIFQDDSGNTSDLVIGGGLDGAGATNKVAIWSSSSALTNDTELHYDPVTNRLGIGTSSPSDSLHVYLNQDAVSKVFAENASAAGSARAAFNALNDSGKGISVVTHSSGHTGTIFGVSRSNSVMFAGYGAPSAMFIGNWEGNAPVYMGATDLVTATTPLLTLATTDRVGISEVSPESKLHIKDAASALLVERTGTGTNAAVGAGKVKATTSSDMVDGFGSTLEFAIEDSAAVENRIAGLGAIRSGGADTSGSLVLFTSDAGSYIERARLSHQGYLGVGTSPSVPLDVSGSVATYGDANVLAHVKDSATAAAGVGGGLAFKGNITGTGTDGVFGAIWTEKFNSTSADRRASLYIASHSSNADNDLTPSVVVYHDSNVAIGSIIPNEKLTVDGVVSLKEQDVSPSDSDGYGKLFVKSSDSHLYFRQDNGTEVDLTSGGGSVGGAGAANKIAYWSDGSNLGADTELHYDPTNNRLGIGTASPLWPLHVQNDINNAVLIKNENQSTGTLAVAALYASSDTSDADARVVSYGSGNVNTTFGLSNAGAVGFFAGPSAAKMLIASQGTTAPIEIGTASNTSSSRALIIGANAGPVVFNEDAADIDLRVEGTLNPDLLFIDASANNIGVGTGNPLSRLHVSDGYLTVDGYVKSSLNGYIFPDGTVQTTSFSSSDGDAQYLRLDASNDPISGELSLSSGLTILGENSNGHAFDIIRDGDNAWAYMDVYGTGTTQNALISRRARGSLASPAASNSGDILFSLIGYGHDATTFRLGPRINFIQNGTTTSTGTPSYIGFTVRDGYGAQVSPLNLLGESANFLVPISASDITSENSDLTISTTTSGNIVLSPSGNVGVGTSSPQSQLHVADGYLTVDGYVHSTVDGFRFPDDTVQTTAAANTPPGGSDGYVQYNNDGEFGGDPGFTWNDTSNTLTINGTLNAVTKSFLIDHPSQPGMKLRYASLEGPENGVYVRGKVQGTVIALPYYWADLVDESTIGVELTPFGKAQHLFVVSAASDQVVISSESGEEPSCFYTVYAERKDVPKLQVEF